MIYKENKTMQFNIVFQSILQGFVTAWRTKKSQLYKIKGEEYDKWRTQWCVAAMNKCERGLEESGHHESVNPLLPRVSLSLPAAPHLFSPIHSDLLHPHHLLVTLGFHALCNSKCLPVSEFHFPSPECTLLEEGSTSLHLNFSLLIPTPSASNLTSILSSSDSYSQRVPFLSFYQTGHSLHYPHINGQISV